MPRAALGLRGWVPCRSEVKIEVTTSSNGRRLRAKGSSWCLARLDVPAYLVLSWRASMGTDDYLQGPKQHHRSGPL